MGLGIHKISSKLQKLGALARRTSMFDDPADEIAELSGIIKQDIRRLNAEIAELQASSASRDGGTKNNVQVCGTKKATTPRKISWNKKPFYLSM